MERQPSDALAAKLAALKARAAQRSATGDIAATPPAMPDSAATLAFPTMDVPRGRSPAADPQPPISPPPSYEYTAAYPTSYPANTAVPPPDAYARPAPQPAPVPSPAAYAPAAPLPPSFNPAPAAAYQPAPQYRDVAVPAFPAGAAYGNVHPAAPAYAMPEKPAEINNRANDLLRAVRGNMSGIEQARKRVQSVDICFVIDCTGSMQHWIDRVKETVTEILDRIRALYPDTQLRTAFVGYRDFEPKDADQSSYEVVEFMAPEYLRERILSVRASGGDDVAEDMLGGLCRVPGLDWQARARVMLVIADAPPHGRRFHGGKYTDRFADKADPNGRRPEDWEGVVRQIVNKQIDVYFLRCHPCTEMFEKEVRDNIFRRHFPSCRFDVLSLDSDDKAEFLEKIMTATRSSMRSAGF